MKNSIINYSVGALLYCPANNSTIVSSLKDEKFGRHFSLALCLEDTIKDEFVEEAENILIESLSQLYNASLKSDFFVPKIFIRVRNTQQVRSLLERLGDSRELITGIIVPKFSPENADGYINALIEANNIYHKTFYLMPILESATMINLITRFSILYELKEKLDSIRENVISIRVGGNDLCHMFGFRRRNDESIHSITPISNIFSDIITVFGMDYIISGPVWEYYRGDNWETGLKNELHDDMQCGFIGKTVIHPNQIEIVHEAFKVVQSDLDDAKAILNWDEDSHNLVLGSASSERMNEYNTHFNWAHSILMRAEAFGVR